MKTILVLNMGMKSIRSMIFDEEGNKLASAAIPIGTLLAGGTVTQSPEEWWEKACRVIRETVMDAGGIPIDYITVTASSSCLLCVDQNGKALTPCMMVSDKRAVKESRILEQAANFQKVKETSGLGADPYLMLPKALWVRDNQKEVFEKTCRFLSPNDYLIARLTGCFVTDYMNAHKWYYDETLQNYPSKLLAELGIPEEMLPEVAAPGTCVGNVLAEVCQATGLSAQTKVIITTYDAICSFIGSGVAQEGEASDVFGTVTVFRTISGRKVKTPGNKIDQLAWKEGNMHIVGGSNNLGGGLIEWVKQCYYQNEALPYELMEKDAGDACMGEGGVIFLPYLLGERAPVWDSNARGVFFGLERMHTRKEMTRAVFESTGFIDVDMIAAIEETGLEVNLIRLSGGLARLNLISQLKADITGKEIKVLSEFETTATGAAMMAFYGQGVFGTLQEAARQFVRIRMVIHPDERNHKQYQELYQLYKETYNTLKPLFPKRMKLMEQLGGRGKTKIENL